MDNIINIDMKTLRSKGLGINEYLDLYMFYCSKKDINIQFREMYNRSADIRVLASKGWLFVKEETMGNITVELRDKTYSLFEGDKDLFLQWFNDFPIKTPSGRTLKVQSVDTNAGRELRKRWNKHFKDKADKAERAIKVLNAEMEWRRHNGKFEFMHNAETWLNQYDYEKYEHLLVDVQTKIDKQREDYI